MEILKYKLIKSENQYKSYCDQLDILLRLKGKTSMIDDEIDLLTVLIEKWENEHFTIRFSDPVELLKTLLEENGLKAVDLAMILKVSKGLVSDILNYNKGFSKEMIRKLSQHFKVSQEAFNRNYPLKKDNKLTRRRTRSIV
jgi:HTH-type transcriptional regulator/antitoxin HigA